MWVQICTIHGKNSNLVVNEKQAWVSRNLHLGTLVDGTVAEVYTFGARVKIKDTDISGLLHISNIARAHIPQVEDVFDAGEQVKVMVVKASSNCRIAFRCSFSLYFRTLHRFLICCVSLCASGHVSGLDCH
jgi:small subunit ribosomal protein S1